MPISPALLLAIVLAAASASLYELVARAPWRLFPLCWLLGVVGFVLGQVVGATWGRSFLVISQLQVGPGLLINALLLLAMHRAVIWYTGHH